MRSRTILIISLVTLLFCAGNVLAQSATVTPNQIPQGAYVNGPGGATDDNFFWQIVEVTLDVAGEGAGETIEIVFPSNITLADVDGTGVDNQPSLSWSGTNTVAGDFTLNAAGTDDTKITVNQVNATDAAADWKLYVMYPVETSSIATGTEDYVINFSDADLTDIPSMPITYREPGALQIVDFLDNMKADDDSTKANDFIGLSYPEPAAATYGALPDLIIDVATTRAFQGAATADDDNTNDMVYSVWASTDSTLSHVSQFESGVIQLENYDTPGYYTQNEGAASAEAYYTGGLPEGEYYFYITSDFTGDFPIARSGKLTVLHYPHIDIAGWDRTGNGFDNSGGDTDDADLTLDTGEFLDVDDSVPNTPNSRTDTDLYISVDDLDDNARLYLFYSTTTSLTKDDVVTAGGVDSLVVTELTGATALVDTLYENDEDVDGFIAWNWDINPAADGSYLQGGDYALYAVACDSKHYHFIRFNGTDTSDTEVIKVRHSPNLNIDVLTEYNLGDDTGANADVTIDPGLTDEIMVSWGKSGIGGDIDIDDSALIEFYLVYDTAQTGNALYGNDVVGVVNTIRTASTAAQTPTGVHKIFSGKFEDLEAKDQSWYAWNLYEDFVASGWYPTDEAAAAGPHYYQLYAIMDENKSGGTTRLLALGSDGIVTSGEAVTTIEFDNRAGLARLLDPPAEGVTVDAAQTYKFNFNAFDMDTDADVGIFLVKKDALVSGETGPTTAIMGLAGVSGLYGTGNGQAYCLTDDNGTPIGGGGAWLSDNTDTSFDFTLQIPGGGNIYTTSVNNNATALSDGEYWAYIGIDDGTYYTQNLTVDDSSMLHLGDWITGDAGGQGYVINIADGTHADVAFKETAFSNNENIDVGKTFTAGELTVGAAGAAAAAAQTDFLNALVPLYRAPGLVNIVNASVASPQRNMTISPMKLTVAQGDTATYTVKVADNAGTVDRLDIYIAVDKAFWSLTNETAPFTTVSAEFQNTMLANQVIDDAANNRWVLRATLFKEAGYAISNTGVGDNSIQFQLVSTGTPNAIDDMTSVGFLNDPARGWVTQFSNNGNDISVNTLGSSVTVVPRGILEGIVELQGRDNVDEVITFELRERGSYEHVVDSLFTAANDADSAKVGIQYNVDHEGKFTFTQVPSGEFELVAIYDRYLAKKVPIEVYNGIDTLFVSFGTLQGGDAVGYTDSLGAAHPDNEIVLADINRIGTAFLADSSSTEWDDGTNNWKWADINEDGVVEVEDLSMATGNINTTGAQPVYKQAAMPLLSNLDSSIEFIDAPETVEAGMTYTVRIAALNTTNVRGYSMHMYPDAESVQFAGILKGDLLSGETYSVPVIDENHIAFANSVMGDNIFSGDGVLAEFSFTALRDGAFDSDMLGLTTVTFVNSDYMKESIQFDNPLDVDEGTPVSFALNQNFPNPFNPTTTIAFTIPDQGLVTMKVYDILGRTVRTLVSGNFQAGSHTVVWDARDDFGRGVSAGVYFYTVEAGSYHQTKRMLLMK